MMDACLLAAWPIFNKKPLPSRDRVRIIAAVSVNSLKEHVMKPILIASLLLFAVATPVSAKRPAPQISEATARATALSLVPGGIIKDGELETEHGQLIYSFDIAQAGKSGIEEIQISAITGKLVSRKHESPAKEAAEAAADARAAKRAKRH
jgi:hypothetical protein